MTTSQSDTAARFRALAGDLRRRQGGRTRQARRQGDARRVASQREDATGEKDRSLYDIGQATERVAAAAQGYVIALVPPHARVVIRSDWVAEHAVSPDRG